MRRREYVSMGTTISWQRLTIDRLERDLEESRRAHLSLLERLAGIEPLEATVVEVAEPRTQDEILSELVAQGYRPGISQSEAREAMAPHRGQWDVPLHPDDLVAEFEDPTDLTAPLDQLPPDTPDAIPPEGETAWAPAEPVAFPEPVPENEERQRIVGIAPGENPIADLGVVPPWHDGGQI